ncbi:DUF4325 domain-containing protein [Leptospira neocaledonica]|uniref:DUF4325 domain-containing protein n=2 Tax=Leptospira neocaledonica TaxID=2023192 RepID=A0A2N0A091_9LEPT|nr:DUF4325 domain-containing protein [Leptospira neocaledonica]
MKKSKGNIIDLDDFRDARAKVFTGRDRGMTVRKQSNLDNLEDNNKEIIIRIPTDIYSINPSFFEELFVNVVRKLGREDFFKKVKFESKGSFPYEKSLNDAVDRILRNSTAID